MYKLLKRRKKKPEIILYADPLKDRHSSREDLPKWQGTIVGIDISLDNTAEFTNLLDYIRDTYSKAVRERKKQRYRLPKFIN